MTRHLLFVVSLTTAAGLVGEPSWAQSTAGPSPFANTVNGVTQPTVPDPAPQNPADAHQDMAALAGIGPLRIRGFNDINFVASRKGNTPNTFAVGQIDLFLTSSLTPVLNMIGEVVIEAGDDNSIAVDPERLLLQYSPSERFSISAGRYHTSIGYYNAAFHHGNWFQTAIGRPFIFRFEDDGGILPVHGVGVSAQGQIPSGRAGLRYVAEVSNGRRSRSRSDEPVQMAADENSHKAVNLGLLARPASIPGLQAGFSVYRDRLAPGDQPSIAETIMAAHLVYESPAFEQLNEVIVIRHRGAGTGADRTTTSFYTQVAPRVGRFHPYVRFEYLNVPGAELDPVLSAHAGRSYGPSFGVRFDAAAPVALKLQYDRLTGPISSQTNGLTVQLAFTF